MQAEFGNPIVIPRSVIFDFSRMTFVRPSGIVFLSNLSWYLHLNGCAVRYEGMDTHRECIRFLDDSGFFEQHLGKSLRETCRIRSTTRPLHHLSLKESHGWLQTNLLPWLSDHSGVPSSELAEFKTCMSEVFNNIVDHTALDVGSIFCQWYPKEDKRLEIAIADFGQGIPATVRRVESNLDDASAILRAFDDGFSSQSTPQNRGAGLHYLRQNVVDNLGGTLTARSQSGVVTFNKSGNSLTSMPYMVTGFCPGTMIEIVIQTDKIAFESGQVEDFQW